MPKTAIPFFVVLLCIQSVYGRSDSLLIDQVKKRYAAGTPRRITFEQDIYFSVPEKHEKKKGVLTCGTGNRFRLELGGLVLVSNGEKLWQYHDKTNQVVIRALNPSDYASLPSQLLKNYLQRSYTIDRSTAATVRFTWTAQPADTASYYRTISIVIDKKKKEIASMIATDRESNVCTYHFRSSVALSKVPDKTFLFTIPKGAEVLDSEQ